MKNKIISLVCIFIICLFYFDAVLADESSVHENIVFVGDDDERLEMEHLLFAKLSYDYLDEYEGMSISDYVNACPELYNKEIWESSGIYYDTLYSSLIGQWQIYKVFNFNDTSGLYAVGFKNEDKIILAFRGSEMFTDEFSLDESNDWIGTDFRFAILNELSPQFEDSTKCYEELMAMLSDANLEYNITFAGHSLGGALVSYQSIITGHYGYSFDGAVGHVMDLVYFYSYLDIENFEGIDKIRFCNYTDTTGYVVADLIQHNYAENMYQIDRETNVEGLNEDNLISAGLDASSHIIWSCVGHEDNIVFLNPKIESVSTPLDAQGCYTYTPAAKNYMDIEENIISYSIEGFEFGFPWNNPENEEIEYEHMLGSLAGVIVDGRVVLGDSSGEVIWGCDEIGVSGAFDVDVVMYGGLGEDYLYGYTADDVLIGGGGNDVLDGNLGNDTYIIDVSEGSSILIKDSGGKKTTVIFRNMNLDNIEELEFNHDDSILKVLNQEVQFQVSQDYAGVELYSYDEGKLSLLGRLSDLTNQANDSENSEFQYIVLLEGKGTVNLFDESDELKYTFTNVVDAGEEGIEFMSVEYGDVYINSETGDGTIMLILDDEMHVEVTNEDERVDMAVGKYSDEDGVFCCKRRYDRNFTDYEINFAESALDDGNGGQITWSDILNGDVSLMDILLQLIGM